MSVVSITVVIHTWCYLAEMSKIWEAVCFCWGWFGGGVPPAIVKKKWKFGSCDVKYIDLNYWSIVPNHMTAKVYNYGARRTVNIVPVQELNVLLQYGVMLLRCIWHVMYIDLYCDVYCDVYWGVYSDVYCNVYCNILVYYYIGCILQCIMIVYIYIDWRFEECFEIC